MAMRASRLRHAMTGVTAVLLAGCSSMDYLPANSDAQNARFQTFSEVMAAYDEIVPGRTAQARLAKLGFDIEHSSNVEVLNYLGVIERFMPRESITLAQLDPAVRSCILARALCTGYIFRPSKKTEQRVGNVILDTLSFRRTTIASGWSAEVLLLVQNGEVSYKLFSGKPHIDGTQQRVQPLGPVQDFGGTATGFALGKVP
jgi:hypothetical protein